MQKLQLEGATFLLPLTLLPAPGPGTLAAVTHLRPHQLTQLNPMQQDREQGFFMGTCLLRNTLECTAARFTALYLTNYFSVKRLTFLLRKCQRKMFKQLLGFALK